MWRNKRKKESIKTDKHLTSRLPEKDISNISNTAVGEEPRDIGGNGHFRY